ncbi:uncharacterized protein F4822DRAFT_432717 [Hypoxylon trugodes]|uniref:uncharacterized protein n=1 Tax=Hypoxylon trugodes TaxID=326681 RepID=UPI0021922676|nr:uncharacterized protein F4822DRAFT_432717 [Hypoxylon trugodes]KAI1385858.1 hypothetical protein F4822DRAFT_432717 [Hypoxylon trugodes]
MGVIRKVLGTAVVATGGGAAYLTATTNITTPLPTDDEIWATKSFKKLNRFQNPVVEDVCWKRLPLSQVRPELRNDEKALATEFCRGLWAGYAYAPQRIILTLALKNPKTENQLFDQKQLASSKYELGTRFSDHFEVVERTNNSIMVRAGGSPLEPGPRDMDGLLVASAKVDKAAGTVDVSLKTTFFNSVEPVRDGKKPTPFVAEVLHRFYSRAMVDNAARSLTG